MQLKIAKLLNKALIIISAIIILLLIGYFIIGRLYPEYKTYYLVGYVIVSILLTILFKWLESSWDKKVISLMVKENHVALFNIKSSKRIMHMRDSAFTNYWLYEFKGDLYDQQHNKSEVTVYEKMNYQTQDIPTGTVYITYDENKKGQYFIIPNLLISHMPSLAGVIASYESDKNIKRKYLDAYYNKGIVLQTFKESRKLQKEEKEEKAKKMKKETAK